ncbi:hypothetical protein PRUPE_5G173400 [Prunus persica]|uniref:Uncharacterized protein n=1 Tax=Prunus persica TaxID=3760 RepID=A0A251P9U3_PRUPE|nr:uncharacterized protein LOC18775816 [Prunus persica]ONI08354.1 hypothetical protein PRUPE_5G173400 [Prunus persica]
MSKPEAETHPELVNNNNNNPCLDLFYNFGEEDVHDPAQMEASCNYVKQVLPLAWSHNSLTALKLVCNLLDGKFNLSAFYTAAFWLHHNHPKTLLCNLGSIFRSFGAFSMSMNIVYHILQEGQEIYKTTPRRGYNRYQLLHKAVKRYKHDRDYQLLHDQVSDILAEIFKSDMEKLKFKEAEEEQNKNNKLKQLSESDNDDRITSAAVNFHYALSNFSRPNPDYNITLLLESIARKCFPPEEYHKLELGGGHGKGKRAKAKYADRVMVKRLKDEVFPSLKKAYFAQGYPPDEASAVETYLEKVKASCCCSGSASKISSSSSLLADALLPHEITGYVHHWNFGRAAELQWKSMVEDVYSKQGKFKNWLAVCDVHPKFMDDEVSLEVSIALGLLLSELSEEPWKGKVIQFSREPQLHSIRGGDDFRYKYEFVRRMTCGVDLDFEKLFDLILQVAVNENLKPDQMIKKVLVLSHADFDRASAAETSWKIDYQAIQSKYKEKGYGDVVPHMVFWTLSKYNPEKPVAPRTQPGVSILNGFSNNLLKHFLNNEGEIGPDYLMELAISDERYQALTVVD